MGAGASAGKEVQGGGWDIGRQLGTGSFGIVKLCTKNKAGEADEALNEYPSHAAIKIIDKTKQPPEEVELLGEEVKVMLKLQHPNCVRLWQWWEDETNLSMVLDLCEGGELFDRIVEKEKYTEKDAAHVVVQVSQALIYMHKNGVVHRDLKPENLLYETKEDDSRIKVTDFGLAKLVEEYHGGRNSDVSMSTTCGTPGYVAPEIIETGAQVRSGYGPEVDVWSLGVILYILLCGYPPFWSENNAELFEKIKTASYDFPADDWDCISAEAKDLIGKILVVKPEDRLTCEDILAHPWLKSASGEVLASSGAVADNMKKMQARSRWRKAQARIKILAKFGALGSVAKGGSIAAVVDGTAEAKEGEAAAAAVETPAATPDVAAATEPAHPGSEAAPAMPSPMAKSAAQVVEAEATQVVEAEAAPAETPASEPAAAAAE